LKVAYATANLFAMLGRNVPAAGPALVLRESAWRRYFAGDARSGGTAAVDGQIVPVAMVVPDDFWRLPGRVDGWLIGGGNGLGALPAQSQGFILGRSDKVRYWRWDLWTSNPEGGRRRFECTALDHQQPLWTTLLTIGIALLILPMLISLHRGDYPRGITSPRRWVFLTAKTALLLPIVYFASIDLTSLTVLGFQPHALLFGYIAAFRWALADQRRRCPVCLRRLTNPTSIGRPSQTFLAWWGTELMCGQGHGLLHVPENPSSSSSSSQRWLTLEQSWSSLFS